MDMTEHVVTGENRETRGRSKDVQEGGWVEYLWGTGHTLPRASRQEFSSLVQEPE